MRHSQVVRYLFGMMVEKGRGRSLEEKDKRVPRPALEKAETGCRYQTHVTDEWENRRFK